jgi:lysophospholipase L1-like esterase
MKKINRFSSYLKISILLLIATLQSLATYAQNRAPIFKEKDKVAFIGNSITHSGWYHSIIYLYYVTRFPQKRLYIFNNGISGDVTAGVLKRFDSDIMPDNATIATVKLGMNDVQRDLYTGNPNENSYLKAKTRSLYIDNMDQLITRLEKAHIPIVLIMPSRFDQTVESTNENKLGVNDALKSYGKILDSIATARHLAGIVDFNSIMDSISIARQKINPTFTLNRADRIHPLYDGHFIMAYQFLKAQNVSKYVSKFKIDFKSKKANDTVRCTVSDLKFSNKRITFSLLEKALPFPLTAYAKDTSLVPFTNTFNQEIAQFTGLPSLSFFNLLIDGQQVGHYSTEELNIGVNLALNSVTPQHKQAQILAKLNEERRQLLQSTRDILLVQFKYLPEGFEKMDVSERKAFLDKKLEQAKMKSNYAYLKTMFENYVINYGKLDDLKKKANELVDQMYASNNPVAHRYEIVLEK